MRKYTILLVDDERNEREGVSFLIERYGYPLQIQQASNGKKALELMEKEHFDILFTDVKMPVMDGLALANEVSKRYPETIIIIFSAYSEFDFAKKAMQAGVVNYLLKPVEIDEFKRCIEEAIEKIQKEQQSHAYEQTNREFVREALLFHIFSGKNVTGREEEALNHIFFDESSACTPIIFEFSDNYFEFHSAYFEQVARTYFGSIIFAEIAPNLAYLAIRQSENKSASGHMEHQLEQFLRALKNEHECLVVAGVPAGSVCDFVAGLGRLNDVRKDVFGYGNRIIYIGDAVDQRSIYARNIEEIKKEIELFIEQMQPENILEGCTQLCTAIMQSQALSRIYITHLLYSIIKSLFDQYPGMDNERALAAAGELFSEKSPEKILEIFSCTVKSILSGASKWETSDSDFVVRIKNYIHKEYRGDLSLIDVAQAVGLAPAYVSHVFKKETGKGIVEYVVEEKMKYAKMLLKDKSMKVVQVARSCGYENQSYFNKLFKAHYGVTPTQYRDGMQK